ncbi:MAG: hypothetical protein K1X71_00410 [Pirellulales bacterium]|nr:hypothetical protein [Pirellulales bacterium]
MERQFARPAFTDGQLEIRIDKVEASIYGRPAGLLALANISDELAASALGCDRAAHVYLEDHTLLTRGVVSAAVPVFEAPQ